MLPGVFHVFRDSPARDAVYTSGPQDFGGQMIQRVASFPHLPKFLAPSESHKRSFQGLGVWKIRSLEFGHCESVGGGAFFDLYL